MLFQTGTVLGCKSKTKNLSKKEIRRQQNRYSNNSFDYRCINDQYLIDNPNHIIVVNCNKYRRIDFNKVNDHTLPNLYPFNCIKSMSAKKDQLRSFLIDEYIPIFEQEFKILEDEIKSNPNQLFLITKLASKYNHFFIFENIIRPNFIKLSEQYVNVVLLW